jgi:hypothetical protein
LPLFFARPEDVVLVGKLPPHEYFEHLEKAGITAPSFVKISGIKKDAAFLTSPKNRLLPWGWSPAAHKLLNPLKPSCSKEFHASPVSTWNPVYREIYSRKFALSVLKSVLPMLPEEDLLPRELVPEICTTRHGMEVLIEKWGRLMVKAPWSSSGRGLQPVTKTPVAPKVWEKLLGIVNEQGYAVVEPYLDKVLDMALQFTLLNGKVRYVGLSRFFTDKKGQYQGNYLNGWPETVGQETVTFCRIGFGKPGFLLKCSHRKQYAG